MRGATTKDFVERAEEVSMVTRVAVSAPSGVRQRVASAGAGGGVGARSSWLHRHPVAAYMTLAYAFSWTIWLLGAAVSGGQRELLNALVIVGAFGPPLSAMLVAALLDPRPSGVPWPRQAAVFTGALVVFALVLRIAQLEPHLAAVYLSYPVVNALVVVLAACIVTGHVAPQQGVRTLLQPLGTWRVGWRWYAISLLLFPLTVLLGNGLWRLLGHPLPPAPYQPEGWLGYLISVPLIFGFVTVYGGALKEEPGWRGLAQRQLQAQVSPLVAALIIGVAWALWHTPLQFTYYGGGLAAVGLRVVVNTLSAIVYAWLYNRTGGSLLPVILLHGANNTMSVFLPITAPVYLLAAVLPAVLVVLDRMWRRLPAGVPLAPLVAAPTTGSPTAPLT
jgi:membrane protease YdiL (CAAX protease family)